MRGAVSAMCNTYSHRGALQEVGVASNVHKEVAAGVECGMILHAFNAAGGKVDMADLEDGCPFSLNFGKDIGVLEAVAKGIQCRVFRHKKSPIYLVIMNYLWPKRQI